MTTIDQAAPTGGGRPGHAPAEDAGETLLARLGLAFTNWAERWFPDAYVFVALAVAVVAAAALHQWGAARQRREIVRRRVLEPDHLHHADGHGGDLGLRGGDLAARRPAHRRIGGDAAQRPFRGRVRGGGEHAHLAPQLGHEPDLLRPPGARAGAAHRSAHGLSGRRRRRLSRPRRHLGAGLELLGRAAAGQSGEPAEGAARHHRGDPVRADHLPVAIHGDRRGAVRGLDRAGAACRRPRPARR